MASDEFLVPIEPCSKVFPAGGVSSRAKMGPGVLGGALLSSTALLRQKTPIMLGGWPIVLFSSMQHYKCRRTYLNRHLSVFLMIKLLDLLMYLLAANSVFIVAV
jgi:hypothetical protein